eukprot:365516-Chlamydomonas_euryale.AAC.6
MRRVRHTKVLITTRRKILKKKRGCGALERTRLDLSRHGRARRRNVWGRAAASRDGRDVSGLKDATSLSCLSRRGERVPDRLLRANEGIHAHSIDHNVKTSCACPPTTPQAFPDWRKGFAGEAQPKSASPARWARMRVAVALEAEVAELVAVVLEAKVAELVAVVLEAKVAELVAVVFEAKVAELVAVVFEAEVAELIAVVLEAEVAELVAVALMLRQRRWWCGRDVSCGSDRGSDRGGRIMCVSVPPVYAVRPVPAVPVRNGIPHRQIIGELQMSAISAAG